LVELVADGDPAAIVKVASGHKSVKDPTFLRFGELAPSTTFVRNGYEYTTDSAGRVIEAGGQLRYAPDSPRYSYHEGQVGNYANDPADQGGHLIARIFGGVSEGVNLTPQLATLNNSAYSAMEEAWKSALLAGGDVDVRIIVEYADDGLRPNRYVIESTIQKTDGTSESLDRIFWNS